MNEIWIDIPINNKNRCHRAIIAISNLGNMKRRNGVIEPIPLRQSIGKPMKLLYRILAEYFLPKTEEDIALGRNCIDHITHNPVDMNVNDVRNLRWCTKGENSRFKESRNNHSAAQTGKLKGRKLSKERCKQISESMKGMHWYNNGIISTRAFECPVGFVEGRLWP